MTVWDPKSFDDTDYGLEPGESFEPEDAWAAYEDVGTDTPHVMTVLGPVAPDELGMCLVREHLLADHGADVDQKLDNVPFAQEEFEAWVARGGRTVVEATTADLGRDAAGLHKIATVVPGHLVAATGSVTGTGTPVELADTWSREILDGIQGTVVKAGIIIAGVDNPEGRDERLQAVVIAHARTGAPVFLIGASSETAAGAAGRLLEAGVDPRHIIAGGRRHDEDADLQVRLAEQGVWLAFDNISDPEARDAATRIASLVRGGFGGQLLISHGHDRRSLYIAYGGHPGITFIQEIFLLQLMDAGVDAQTIRGIMIDNPAQALVTLPREQRGEGETDADAIVPEGG